MKLKNQYVSYISLNIIRYVNVYLLCFLYNRENSNSINIIERIAIVSINNYIMNKEGKFKCDIQ